MFQIPLLQTRGRLSEAFAPARLALVATLVAVPLATVPMTVPAFADDHQSGPATEITRSGTADDVVRLEIVEEEWVETTTATVQLAADLAVEAGTFGTARASLEEKLAGFVPDVDWRIVDFRKLRDDAGFERWRVIAEARVPEAALADLPNKAKDASVPGSALSVSSVDYTPTLAEREATVAELRARIYARAAAELAVLNKVFPDRNFRIHGLQMAPDFRPQPRPAMLMRAESTQAADAAMSKGGGLAGAEKATVAATVELAAEAARMPDKD